MKSRDLDLVKVLLKSEKAMEAKQLFASVPEEETIEYWFIKGELEQKFQHWGKAFNAYSKVLIMDPGNQEAKNHLQIINGIMSFWNPDQFNP